MADGEVILRELLDDILQELNYTDQDVAVKAITSGGANYTSALYLATVTNGHENDLNLFAKVACVGEKLRKIMNADCLFKTESFVYKKLAKIYCSFQEKYNILDKDRFVFPKFYGCNSELFKETVVLENLVTRGYKAYDRFKSIDWEHASSAVETLAKFHALSFAYQNERPEEFEKVVEDLKFQMPKRDDEAMKATWGQMISRATSVVDEEDGKRIMDMITEAGKDLFVKYNRPLGVPVLIHGDYRPSNLLFKNEANKTHTIPVDYQTVRSGCPVADLIYFIFMGSDKGFRARHYDQLVQLYYEQLVLATERLGLDSQQVYPREQFDSELREMLPYALLIGVAVLPIVLVEAAQAPRVDGDADIASFVINSNELFAERFRGIVEDLVQWGVL